MNAHDYWTARRERWQSWQEGQALDVITSRELRRVRWRSGLYRGMAQRLACLRLDAGRPAQGVSRQAARLHAIVARE